MAVGAFATVLRWYPDLLSVAHRTIGFGRGGWMSGILHRLSTPTVVAGPPISTEISAV